MIIQVSSSGGEVGRVRRPKGAAPVRRLGAGMFATLALVLALPASAGPPFLTDDPEPVPYRHWEAYLFSTLDASLGGTAGSLPAFELNFGAAPDLQLHLVLPVAFAVPREGPRTVGLGDVTLGFKFRFLHETESTPQIGIFPMVTVPTGSADRGLGGGGSVIVLPVWGQKSWGPWTTYGGGGYTINNTPAGRNYLSGGWLLQRQLSERTTLGGEVFSQGRSSNGAPGTTILNAGGQCGLAEGISLLLSLGHSVAGARHRLAYLGLYWTWGPPGPPQS